MSVIVRALGSGSPNQALVPSDPSVLNSHIVAFYDDESVLVDALAESVHSSILAGNSAMVIATPAHHDGFFDSIADRAPYFHAAILEGRLFLLDAAETLSKFMVDGQPDPDLFAESMGYYLELLSSSARGKNSHVFAFGEMVAVLWEQGHHAAALRVEQLWNQLVVTHSFRLCCAYPLRLFPDISAAQNRISQERFPSPPRLPSLRLPRKVHLSS